MRAGWGISRRREQLLKDIDHPLRNFSLDWAGWRVLCSLSIAQMPVPVPMSRMRLSRSVLIAEGDGRDNLGCSVTHCGFFSGAKCST